MWIYLYILLKYSLIKDPDIIMEKSVYSKGIYSKFQGVEKVIIFSFFFPEKT